MSKKFLNKDYAPVIFVFCFFVLVIFLIMSRYEYNMSSLIKIGDMHLKLGTPLKGLVVFINGGHDGGFYYFTAQDLFPDKGLFPLVYYQRILYPFLVFSTQ